MFVIKAYDGWVPKSLTRDLWPVTFENRWGEEREKRDERFYEGARRIFRRRGNGRFIGPIIFSSINLFEPFFFGNDKAYFTIGYKSPEEKNPPQLNLRLIKRRINRGSSFSRLAICKAFRLEFALFFTCSVMDYRLGRVYWWYKTSTLLLLLLPKVFFLQCLITLWILTTLGENFSGRKK